MKYVDNLAGKLSSYTIKKVPIADVLPDLCQPRKRYDTRKIGELAEKMKRNGLISFPLAELTRGKEYKEYIRNASDGYAKNFFLSKIVDNKKYYFLVVGHRRLLAAKKAGFSYIKLKVLKDNLSVLERRIVQIDEDSMLRPPAWQNAKATYNLYKLIVKDRKEAGIKGRYTLHEFSQYLGVGESTVQKHIRYARLPQKIKNLVEKEKTLKYQNALQIARLHSEQEQLRIASLYGKSPERKLKEIVTSMLEKRKKRELGLELRQENVSPINELLQKKKEYFRKIEYELYRAAAFCDIDPDYKKHIKLSCSRNIKYLLESFSMLEKQIDNATNGYIAKLKKTIPLNGKKQNTETIDKIILNIEKERRNSKINGKREILSEKYLRQINVYKIKENPNNPRGDVSEEDIDALAVAIKRDGGLLNPVLVKKQKNGYMLEFGHRRVLAAKRAGLRTIAAFVVDDIPESLALDLQIMENTQVPFSEEERAYGLAQIYDLAGKDSVDGFISELGISRKTGLMALKYQKCLDPFVKNLVENGLLAYSAALQLAGKEREEQKSLALVGAANEYTKEDMMKKIKERNLLKNQQSLFKGIGSCLFEYKKISEKFFFMLKNLEQEISVIRSRHKSLLENSKFAKAIFRTTHALNKLKSSLE